MEYDVYLGSEVIGKVQVVRQGLYYQFSCRCRLSGDVMYRLGVSCGAKRENLGILVPLGQRFGLDTRLAVKRLGEGSFRFRVLPKHQKAVGQFVPLHPEEPFAYITRLQETFLETRDGQVGLVLSAGPSAQPATRSPWGP